MTDKQWGGYGDNIYYNPEKCGLELVAVLDADLSWEFDMVLCLRDLETKKLYLASDSGCSCPTPFEDFRSLSDLTPIENIDQVREATNKDYASWSASDRDTFLKAVADALQ